MPVPVRIRESIQAFKKKYYTNDIIRGTLILLLVISTAFLTVVFGEAIFNFSVLIRTILFYTLLGVFFITLVWKILIPFLSLLSIGKHMNDVEAARFIGKYIHEIDDKLLNIIQLGSDNEVNNDLLQAAIEKKSKELAVFPFTRAVSFKANNKMARYLLGPLVFLIILLLVQPEVLTQGSYRLVNYKQDFPPPPPFLIRLESLPERLEEGKILNIEAEVNGKELPAELFVFVSRKGTKDWIPYPMHKRGLQKFSVDVQDIVDDIKIQVGNTEVKTPVYEIKIWKAPAVGNFTTIIKYPSYTNRASDTLPENIGDFTALKGSMVFWVLNTKGSVEQAYLVFDNVPSPFKRSDNKNYILNYRIIEEKQYHFRLKSNENILNTDTISYRINVEEDRFPSALIRSPQGDFKLSITGVLPLDYDLGDDYGISKAELWYRFTKSQTTQKIKDTYTQIILPYDSKGNTRSFHLDIDFGMMGVQTGDEIEYFVKVWDNDGYNGPKSSQSMMQKIINPSLNQLYEETEKQSDEINKQLETLTKDTEKLNKDYEKFQKKLIEKKSLDYEDKKQLKQMIEKQSQINESLNEVQEKLDKNRQQQKENNLLTPETLKKLEQLQNLVKELQSPELNEYLKKLKDEMEKLRPEDLKREMEQTKLDREQLQKDIERAMDLFKQFQAEQKAQEIMKKLDNLKSRQDQLNEQTEKKNTKEEQEKLKEKQDELNKEMEKIKESIAELENLKKETSTPQQEDMKALEKAGEETKNKMEQSSQQMQEGKPGKASDSQKDASKKMQEMKDKLDQMASNADMEQDAENLEDLRDILENLIKISFEQEDLRDQIRKIRANDPQMNARAQDQRKIQDDMGMLRDSLYALASRVTEIKKFVTDEVTTIQKSIDRGIYYLGERNLGMAGNDQQMAMTSMNNLANMLSDAMEQMMQQMKKKGQPMSQSLCKKPGGKKPNMMQLGQQQKEVNRKLQDMMKLGKMDPKEMGRLAAEQELIRQQMKDAQEQMEEDGKPGLGNLEKVKEDMEKSEQEMINNVITQETLLRQQRILSRMLDATKSVRERDLDEQRQSRTGRIEDRQSPSELSEKERQDKLRYELLKTLESEYQPAIKILIEQYFQEFGKH